MWIASTYGFFSVVHKPKDDRGTGAYHVRARRRGDLENLIEASPGLRAGTEIFEHDLADYRYRIVVDMVGFGQVMTVLTNSVDYSNFKGRIDALPDQRDKHRYYAEMWGVMHDYQVRTRILENAARRQKEEREDLDLLAEGWYGPLDRGPAIHPSLFPDSSSSSWGDDLEEEEAGCAWCGEEIRTGELCARCAEYNDPFGQEEDPPADVGARTTYPIWCEDTLCRLYGEVYLGASPEDPCPSCGQPGEPVGEPEHG